MSEKKYEIKFLGIELVSKSIVDPPRERVNEIDFAFNFSVDLKLTPERKIVIVVTDVTILRLLDNQPAGAFKVICVFELSQFDELFVKVEDNKYDIPMELEVILKAAGLSTTRGIVYSEVRGTYLQNAVLPLIDMTALIKNQREGKTAETT